MNSEKEQYKNMGQIEKDLDRLSDISRELYKNVYLIKEWSFIEMNRLRKIRDSISAYWQIIYPCIE